MSGNKLTPVMQQYVDIKAENPGSLLLFRLGDFYEVFFEDAKIVSKCLGIVLTKRGLDENGNDIPMCGLPWHAAENYFGRLVRSGYSIALVEQMETPAQAKAAGRKNLERSVVRVLTPGTINDDNLLSPKKSNFLVAVVEKQNTGVFDVAGCDISTGEFFVGQSDCVIDDLARINPAEIIYPEKAAENETVLKIRQMFKTTPVYERLYYREDCKQIISKIFGQTADWIKSAGSLNPSFEENSVALLAGYLFNTQRGANITFQTPYNFKSGKQLLIDSATWKSLEIDSAINDGGKCLVDILDRTQTSAGGRKLHSYLRSLSADIDEIKQRQEHIGHLIINTDVLHELTGNLANIPDVGRSLSRLLSNRGTPKDLRSVCDFINSIGHFKTIGARLDSKLSARFGELKEYYELGFKLKSALSDALPTFFRDGDIIKTGFDVGLDNMKELANGARNTIAKLQSEYAENTGVSTLKIKYNNILGYFIEVPSARAESLMSPTAGFIHRQTMAGNMRFTTSQLIDLDNEVRSAAEKVKAIEDEIIKDLINDIQLVSEDLMKCADLFAEADVWAALAIVADEYSWVRPDITNDIVMEIVGGRHPVIEYVLKKSGNTFVKNDCELNSKKTALLTGPNMAGKSTYLRQNALLIVLSHLGSFVPAVSAKIGICDQLFSRVGASDNLAAGQSTFMIEMVETANILNRATSQSFIIFDEIGRGTATWDGMAIAQSVLEYLDEINPRTLFATHYHELTKLVNDGKLNNVQCLTIDVREHNNEIIFMHKIISGVANRSYGIHVAKMAGMPEKVVSSAQKILNDLESKTSNQPVKQPVKAKVVENAIVVEKGVRTDTKVASDNKKSQLNLFG